MAALSAFDDLIAGSVKPWVESSSCWPNGAAGAALVLQAFEAQKAFLEKALSMKKPSDEEVCEMVGPTGAMMEAIGDFEGTNSKDATYSAYGKVLVEGAGAFSWVLEALPAPHVTESGNSMMYQGNRIIKEQKGKNDAHCKWVRDFKQILDELAKYCKAHHTCGVAWGTAAGMTAAADSGAAAATGGQSVQAYDAYLPTVDKFVKASEAVAPSIGAAAKALQDAFVEKRAFLVAAENHSKPGDEVFGACLAPIVAKMEAVSDAAGKVKDRDLGLHAKAIEEGAQLVTWVSVPTTVGQIKEVQSSVDYNVNKIRMQKKGEDVHMNYCQAWKDLLLGLIEYVTSQHKQGLNWGVGKPAMTVESLSGGGAPAGGAAPAPAAAAPAPTGPPKPTAPKVQPKKVELKTIAAQPSVMTVKIPKGQARFEREMKKWTVEYQVGEPGNLKKIELKEDVDRSQVVYVYGCQYMDLDIIGKVNSITLDSCKGCHVSFDSCVGSVEITGNKDGSMVIRDVLQTLSIDKSDNQSVQVTQACVDAGMEINTSTATNIDIGFPEGKAQQIPEMFVSRVQKGNKIGTKVLEEAA